MKIKWAGKYSGDNLPTADICDNSHELPEVVWQNNLCKHCSTKNSIA